MTRCGLEASVGPVHLGRAKPPPPAGLSLVAPTVSPLGSIGRWVGGPGPQAGPESPAPSPGKPGHGDSCLAGRSFYPPPRAPCLQLWPLSVRGLQDSVLGPSSPSWAKARRWPTPDALERRGQRSWEQSLTLSAVPDSLPALLTLAWGASHCHSPQHRLCGHRACS